MRFARSLTGDCAHWMAVLLPGLLAVSTSVGTTAVPEADAHHYEQRILPLLNSYCLDCHSTKREKGDLDLERFDSLEKVLQTPAVWEKVVEQLTLGEMPPEDEPQLSQDELDRLQSWVDGALNAAALRNAGDPGPVVLRRLNNAEYTWTIRDLTGIESLDPAREFPGDSASGEGFMNVGNSLVMSPALLAKYLDAAKGIADHTMLLPDGIAFSPSTSRRDWTEEKLAAIRAFYAQFTESGGGTAVDLQGIKFDTKDGGVLPLEKYFRATLLERDSLRGGRKFVKDAAIRHQLNAKYLGTLWAALNATNESPLLDPLRSQWLLEEPEDAAALVASVSEWQRALWRFTTVGHIGKRDGPKGWQVRVNPLAESREVRLKIPTPSADGGDVSLFLVTSDAGDGNESDFAVWKNPRLVAPGQPDLLLRDVRAAADALSIHHEKVIHSAAKCLVAAAEVTGPLDEKALALLAQKNGVEATVLEAWLDCLGIGGGEVLIDSHMTDQMESAQSYDFIKGWVGADALSVIANSSDQHVRVPGNMKPHGIAVHPSPSRRVLIGWQSPVAANLRIEGSVQHAHPECGNGVTWALEMRRSNIRQRLATGTAQGGAVVKFGPVEDLAVQPGDLISLVVGPRDGNHSCDLTAMDLTLTDGTNTWDLAKDVSPNILAGNPHADSLGNAGVWHFYSEPDNGGGAEPVLPAGSLLARWRSSNSAAEKQVLANELEELLVTGGAGLTKDAPDAALYRQLTSVNGPLLSTIASSSRREEALNKSGQDRSLVTSSATNWGLDPAMFADGNLAVNAPSVIEVRLPAEFVEGCEFVATTTLDKSAGAEGSVQMQVLTTRPKSMDLAAGGMREQGNKSTWSDGERPVVSDSPILVSEGGAARRRMEAAFNEFCELFPAALCYTKIVPVDEVVTLTLFYREDDQLQRLMLNDSQSAKLDQLWDELRFVSRSPLKLVDAFEQLWQFATQDADPSAFEPLREPILQRAEEFKRLLKETQPAHLDAVIHFAEGAYRHPLSNVEKSELRGLYRQLRDEEISHERAVRLTLARTLVSPAFLYRLEEPPSGDQQGPVTDWELATRLSYFLWSSAPDMELRAIAASGELRNPAVLAAQTRRMLRDPRVRRLATEFGCAWLHIYDFDSLDEKSSRHFPTFADLRSEMYEEAIQYFTDLFQNDASVLTLFDADHTFLNERMAAHYEIPGVTGPEWRRVDGVRQYGRGGVLGMGATLAKHSGASRTSPILRGNWVAEVLLGDKLPRPPAGVPQLPEDEATETLTIRELTERHSSDPKCYGCHMRIDGYGFAMEAYDAIGRFRTEDLGGRLIDTRTKVFDGTEVEDAQGLREYLLGVKRRHVLRQFNRKLLGYALGRSVILSDKPLLDEIANQLELNDYRFGSAVEAIVRSRPFREIRGRKMVADAE